MKFNLSLTMAVCKSKGITEFKYLGVYIAYDIHGGAFPCILNYKSCLKI